MEWIVLARVGRSEHLPGGGARIDTYRSLRSLASEGALAGRERAPPQLGRSRAAEGRLVFGVGRVRDYLTGVAPICCDMSNSQARTINSTGHSGIAPKVRVIRRGSSKANINFSF